MLLRRCTKRVTVAKSGSTSSGDKVVDLRDTRGELKRSFRSGRGQAATTRTAFGLLLNGYQSSLNDIIKRLQTR